MSVNEQLLKASNSTIWGADGATRSDVISLTLKDRPAQLTTKSLTAKLHIGGTVAVTGHKYAGTFKPITN
ncbi:hypothetical protein TK35_14175 [Lacticaseibacillus paracasei]|nr:hypothetical protein TK35_14175 [Lacticaseibacillus paracasei]